MYKPRGGRPWKGRGARRGHWPGEVEARVGGCPPPATGPSAAPPRLSLSGRRAPLPAGRPPPAAYVRGACPHPRPPFAARNPSSSARGSPPAFRAYTRARVRVPLSRGGGGPASAARITIGNGRARAYWCARASRLSRPRGRPGGRRIVRARPPALCIYDLHISQIEGTMPTSPSRSLARPSARPRLRRRFRRCFRFPLPCVVDDPAARPRGLSEVDPRRVLTPAGRSRVVA